MASLFLIQVRLDEEADSFLMVGEELDDITARVREKYKGNKIEWTDIVEIIEVDKYKIKLVKE
jgi:hypothetical protein